MSRQEPRPLEFAAGVRATAILVQTQRSLAFVRWYRYSGQGVSRCLLGDCCGETRQNAPIFIGPLALQTVEVISASKSAPRGKLRSIFRRPVASLGWSHQEKTASFEGVPDWMPDSSRRNSACGTDPRGESQRFNVCREQLQFLATGIAGAGVAGDRELMR